MASFSIQVIYRNNVLQTFNYVVYLLIRDVQWDRLGYSSGTYRLFFSDTGDHFSYHAPRCRNLPELLFSQTWVLCVISYRGPYRFVFLLTSPRYSTVISRFLILSIFSLLIASLNSQVYEHLNHFLRYWCHDIILLPT